MTVADVTVDGAPVVPELALDDTALRVPLPVRSTPGRAPRSRSTFTTTVPADSTGSYGIFSRDTRNGTWVLADWYPILAVWEEGDGWALPEATSFGDPTYAPSAFYDVRVTAPDDLEVVATGVVATETNENGAVTRRFIAGPARDFVMVADDDHAPLSQEVDGTRLTLWTAPSLDPAIGEQTLEAAADALRYYNERFGAYPAREIDLVQTDPSGALGIAWAGLLFLDGPALLGTYGEHDPEGLATVVAHEVAHLWWGILVGGDSNKHAYIQEGLATVSSLLYLKETLGPEAAGAQLDAWVTGPALDLLAAGDAVVDVPVAEGDDPTIWSDCDLRQRLARLSGHPRGDRRRGVRDGVARPRHPLRLGRDDPGRAARGLRARLRAGSRRPLEPLVRRGGDDAGGDRGDRRGVCRIGRRSTTVSTDRCSMIASDAEPLAGVVPRVHSRC